jgi:transposase, IS605 OrfB family, central region
MLKAYKYRIYPNEEQKTIFAKTFGCVRLVWNLMLKEKLERYQRISELKNSQSLSGDLRNAYSTLTAYNNKEKIPRVTPAKYKSEYPFLKEVDSLALANTQLNLEKAFKNYFKNPKHFGLPKFKKKKNKQAYTTNNVNNNIKIDFENGLLYLPRIKNGIKIKLHRKFEEKIKSVTIVKTTSGLYYASILVETENVKNKVKEPRAIESHFWSKEQAQPLNSSEKCLEHTINRVCGIDLGLKDFAIITNDTGIYKIEHPKYLRKAEKRLKRLQIALSRKQKGSKNFEKARKRLAIQYEYVSNARNDFLHKLSKAIIDDNQVIVVEDLNVKGMQKTDLAKPVSDSGFGTFVRYLEYKADWYGRQLIKVDRFYPSSKLCSVCGYKYKELKLSDRYWQCPICGTYHDRDINASINLYKVGMEQPEFKPVEHALVDDRIPFGIPKKPSCDEAGSRTFYKVR